MKKAKRKTYDVHLFCVVRVKVPGIQASSQRVAIAHAENLVDMHELFRSDNIRDMPACVSDVENAEEFSHYLVDEVGDKEHEHTQWYRSDLSRVKPG